MPFIIDDCIFFIDIQKYTKFLKSATYAVIFLYLIVCICLVMANENNTYKNQIANKIKKLRIDAGYTSYENFANAHDIDRKQYWRIESGSNITISSLIKIIKMHNITVAEFFSDIY